MPDDLTAKLEALADERRGRFADSLEATLRRKVGLPPPEEPREETVLDVAAAELAKMRGDKSAAPVTDPLLTSVKKKLGIEPDESKE